MMCLKKSGLVKIEFKLLRNWVHIIVFGGLRCDVVRVHCAFQNVTDMWLENHT